MEIAEYLSSALELKRRFFPDIAFTNRRLGNPLILNVPEQPVQAIRLSLQEKQPLHLASLELSRGNGPAIKLDDRTRLSLSSSYKGEAVEVAAKRFFDPNTSHVGFHTENENSPWALVQLHEPVSIDRILLNNRGDQYASRARTLRVEISSGDEDWTEVYNGLSRWHIFQAVLTDQAVRRGGAKGHATVIRFVNDILSLLFLHDYQGASKLLKSYPGVSWDRKNELIANLNQTVLPPLQLEWTTHGVHRSFRYWSDAEKLSYLQFTTLVAAALNECFENRVCLGFGSVLSIVRDRALMPHDDDLDIIALLPAAQCRSFEEGKALVTRLMTERGFVVPAEHPSHIKVRREGQKSVDVFIGIEEGDRATWYPGPRGEILIDEVFPPIPAVLYGVSCPIPRSPFVYLEKVYGPSWGTPQPRWSHKWDKSAVGNLLS